MDDQNPAVTRQVQIPPALLEEVGASPQPLEVLCRKMYLVGADRVQRMMRDPNVPLAQRIAWLDHLAKYGGLGAKPTAAAAAAATTSAKFGINIVIPPKDSDAAKPTVMQIRSEVTTEPAAAPADDGAD